MVDKRGFLYGCGRRIPFHAPVCNINSNFARINRTRFHCVTAQSLALPASSAGRGRARFPQFGFESALIATKKDIQTDVFFCWLREKDSNPHKTSQSRWCYHYTIPQHLTDYNIILLSILNVKCFFEKNLKHLKNCCFAQENCFFSNYQNSVAY